MGFGSESFGNRISGFDPHVVALEWKLLTPNRLDSGRTNHIHIVLHEDATELANGTISGGTVSHIGQLFWDQDLIDLVETTSPYSTNTNPVTTNAEDHVFGEQETEDTTSDPVFNYVYYNGEDLTDGLFTWIQIGVNTSASYSKLGSTPPRL